MANMQQKFQAGQTHGQTQEKVEDWIESTKDSANAARDKTANTAQSARDSAQQGTEQSANFLQQTGEQVMNMAQGAVETVKNTLGVGADKVGDRVGNKK